MVCGMEEQEITEGLRGVRLPTAQIVDQPPETIGPPAEHQTEMHPVLHLLAGCFEVDLLRGGCSSE